LGTLFLQEVDATVMVTDVKDFSTLAKQLGPVELSLALSRFYEHVGSKIERHHGRIVKFIGDGVMSVFVGGGTADHCKRALLAVMDIISSRQAFLDENQALKLPVLDYVVGVATGRILAGEMGTEKLRFYDVLGQPVNYAFRINGLATQRGVSNLVDGATYEGVRDRADRPGGIETDGVELDGDKIRLFKLDG
jgi:adenylate cyclase